jgi:pimeloyl-ACP methyl ester carboxylesterase
MDDLPHIRVPTLIVVGAEDTPFIGASEYMAKRIPGSRRVVLPDAGHMPNLDQPELFRDAVSAFLDTLPA